LNKRSNALNRSLMVLAVLLGLFLFLRGAWVGTEGLTGSVQLDPRDWKLVALFIVSRGGFALLAFPRIRRAQSKDQ
jgi:hypothetical protein